MMNYSSSARLAVKDLKGTLDSAGVLWASRALYALVSESPADTILSKVLSDREVWFPGKRMKFRQEMHRKFADNDWAPSHGEWAKEFGSVIAGIEESAYKESAPEVNEHHIADVLYTYEEPGNEGRSHYMSDQGIYVPTFRKSVDCLVGRVGIQPGDCQRMWAFCDTSFFQEYQPFDQVDWARELRVPDLVLVVPLAVVRELDAQKSGRERLRDRARQVLPKLRRISYSAAVGQSAQIDGARTNIKLLVETREPSAWPLGLDPAQVDDAVIASALGFRWSHNGSRVNILTGDTGIALKARTFELDCPEISSNLSRDHQRGDNSDTGTNSAATVTARRES